MKSDIQGCSTCPTGGEQYEEYTSHLGRKPQKKVQYDYRHTNGKLFSCIADDLESARAKKNAWLKKSVQY